MVTSITLDTGGFNPTSYIPHNRIDEKELKMAERVLAQAVSDNGKVDFSNKSEKEQEKITEAAFLVVSAQQPEQEGETSFKMSMANVDPLYNEDGLPSSVTETAAFKYAESKYGPAAKGAGQAADTVATLDAITEEMQAELEAKAAEALEQAAIARQEEQARLEAEKLATTDTTTTIEVVEEHNNQQQDTSPKAPSETIESNSAGSDRITAETVKATQTTEATTTSAPTADSSSAPVNVAVSTANVANVTDSASPQSSPKPKLIQIDVYV